MCCPFTEENNKYLIRALDSVYVFLNKHNAIATVETTKSDVHFSTILQFT
jgi:hypothetical protein